MTKLQIKTGCKSALTAIALLAGGMFAVNGFALAQSAVVTTQSTIATNLSGVAGNIASNKFGDVFQASTYGTGVYEFPASGAAPILLFQLGTGANYSGKGLGGVAVDANQNLYVTTIYVGAQSSTDSAIYELPYVNGSYPTYTLNAPVAPCGANPTTVCSWGNFLQPAGYYYQGWDFAIDGNGTGYLVTLYDNTKANNIYECPAACEAKSQNATILVGNLPNPVLSITADAVGDVFYADGSNNAYVIPAGTTTPVAVSGTFNATIGVALDRAGNLYVTDTVALYEIPVKNGSYTSSSPSEILPLPGGSVRGYNGGGAAIDREGNIYTPTGFANLYKVNVDNGSFAPAAAQAGTSALTFNVIFNKTVASAALTATGAQAAEFQISGSTCATGGTTCSFNGTFAPAGVGLRRSVLTLTDSSGDTVPLALSGVGQGPAITVDPGTTTAVGTGFTNAAGVAVDTTGNLFIADSSAGSIYEYPAGTKTQRAVAAGFTSPTGIAVDGGGNLYVADAGGAGSSGRIVEVPLVAGVYNTASQTTIATGLGALKGLFVDGYGTVFAADSTNKDVFSLPRAQFGQAGGATFGSGLTAPSDVAVDATGNLYIADPQANQVVLLTTEGVQSAVGTGLSAPTGVAVDPSGSVIIADRGNQRVVRVPNESGTLNPGDQIAIVTALTAPYAVRLDASGNLAVDDNTANVLDSVNRTRGNVVFTNVNVNTVSGAQPAYLSSEGTSGLGLSSPLYTSPAAPFSLVQGTPACTPGSTLAAGFSCQLSATFAPSNTAPQSVNVALGANALNTSSPSITLQGKGLQLVTPTVTLQQTAPTGTIAYGQSASFTATVSGSSGTPTGQIVLYVDGSAQPAKTLVNGSYTFTVPGLSGGQHSLYAQYLGDGVTYAGAVSMPPLVVTVAQATSTTSLSITATALSPLSAAVGDTVTFSSTLVPSVPGFFSGTVNFVSGGVTLASAPVVAGPAGTYTASVATTTVPAGNYQVVAVYTGNNNYAGSSSLPPVSLQVVATTSEILLTPASSSITASLNKPGSTLLTLSSLAGFQGGVVFSCANLPSNATCTFNPAILTLLANGTASPVTVPPLTNTLTIAVDQAPLTTPTAITPWAALLLLLMLLRFGRRRRAWRIGLGGLAALASVAVLCGGVTGCGNGISNKTAAGTYAVTVTAIGTPSVPATTPTTGANNSKSSFTLNLIVQ